MSEVDGRCSVQTGLLQKNLKNKLLSGARTETCVPRLPAASVPVTVAVAETVTKFVCHRCRRHRGPPRSRVRLDSVRCPTRRGKSLSSGLPTERRVGLPPSFAGLFDSSRTSTACVRAPKRTAKKTSFHTQDGCPVKKAQSLAPRAPAAARRRAVAALARQTRHPR